MIINTYDENKFPIVTANLTKNKVLENLLNNFNTPEEKELIIDLINSIPSEIIEYEYNLNSTKADLRYFFKEYITETAAFMLYAYVNAKDKDVSWDKASPYSVLQSCEDYDLELIGLEIDEEVEGYEIYTRSEITDIFDLLCSISFKELIVSETFLDLLEERFDNYKEIIQKYGEMNNPFKKYADECIEIGIDSSAVEKYKELAGIVSLPVKSYNIDYKFVIKEQDRIENPHYDEKYIRCEDGIKDIQSAVKNYDVNSNTKLSVMIMGVPGSGKSEYAINMFPKFIRITPGVLLSKWIGEAEKTLRNTFLYAEKMQIPIIIDELDGILVSRESGDHHTKSVTVEFLTILDSYRGILISTTNFFDEMDIAFSRRFTYKKVFEQMSKDVIGDSCINYFKDKILGFDEKALNKAIRSISKLCLGDLRVVYDQLELERSKLSVEDLSQRLRREVGFRSNKVITNQRSQVGLCR